MKQMSTGFGLAVLGFGIAVLGLSNLAGSRGNQAQAQTGGSRSIVSASLIEASGLLVAYRIWSDNTIDVRPLGQMSMRKDLCYSNGYPNGDAIQVRFARPQVVPAGTTCDTTNSFGEVIAGSWLTVDNGLTSFVPADVDASGTVDPADLGGVLIEMGNTQEGNPPPPIDCTINAPR